MSVRAILLFFCGGVFTVANATSLAPIPALVSAARAQKLATNAICRVSGRFVEARPKAGKIVWIFDRLSTGTTTCTLDSSRFEVWIWQGRYSTLNGQAVYPVYLNEPAAGAEVDLQLENQSIRELPSKTTYSGWFLAEGDVPVQVRAR